MKFWQSISWAEAEQLVEIAKFAEEVGFHGVINSEHLFLTHKTGSNYPYSEDGKMNHALDYDYPDVWTSFAAMAAVSLSAGMSGAAAVSPFRNFTWELPFFTVMMICVSWLLMIDKLKCFEIVIKYTFAHRRPTPGKNPFMSGGPNILFGDTITIL